ncbi:MFS transporter [Kangiella spongicola]|uniref:MFS transporter n=1 Tax=Kangiella spongicola TaxID=796379 RepID=A0A318CZS0_9GAMM|nr:MFS transporter [Kangiella spongicola]PXF62472.1 MFS transporter [Kangiella spongicola]
MTTKLKPQHSAVPSGRVFLFVCIILIAMNLRAPFTAMAPLLEMIEKNLGLDTAAAGVIMAIPLFAFMIFSPFVPQLARRFGLELSLLYTIILIALGIIIRSYGNVPLLYMGTAIVGIGIAAGNVILPSLIKLKFPHKIPLITSSYVLMMGVTAAIYSPLVIPLAQFDNLGWRFASGVFIIIPIIAILLWAPQVRHRSREKAQKSIQHGLSPIWRFRLAWQVTLFFGCNSLLFYAMISWLPAIFNQIGLSPEKSATLHGVLQLASAIPGLILVPIINRTKDQRGIAILVTSLNFIGLLGLILLPSGATFWTIIIGLGSGGGFILALSFIGLRTQSSDKATSLSSMSQTLGYLTAGIGTLALGSLADFYDNWQPVLIVCMGLCVTQGTLGIFAGRSVQIKE